MISKREFDSICAEFDIPTIDETKYTKLEPYYEMLAPMYLGDIDAFQKILPEIAENSGLTEYEIIYLVGINLVPMAHEAYHLRGIPEKIFHDTFTVLKIWFDNCANERKQFGIYNYWWMYNHLKSDIFRINRLEFAPMPLDFEVPGYKMGVDSLAIHIPQDKDLKIEDVRASIAAAPEFFKKYFDRDIKLLHCHSWLLHPSLQDNLGPDSNIVKFQKEFEIISINNTAEHAIPWIFGRTAPVEGPYPLDTTLRRNTAKYLENGGKIGTAGGVIRL